MGNVIYGNNFLADTRRGMSKNLWKGFPWQRIRTGELGGVWVDEDFDNQGPITAVTTDAHLIGMNVMGFNSTGGTHTMADVPGGVLVCTEATDNEASYARGAYWPFQISSLLGELVFEARIKVGAITDNQIGFICGLWDNVACSVVVPLSTANPPILATTGNFVGFWGPEEDAGGVNTVYKADGVTMGAVQTLVHQFVADTYVKLGMRFFPNYRGTSVAKLAFYVNGVEQTSTVTVPNNIGTGFPADVRLGWLFGHRLGASTSSLTSCDSVKIYQLDATP